MYVSVYIAHANFLSYCQLAVAAIAASARQQHQPQGSLHTHFRRSHPALAALSTDSFRIIIRYGRRIVVPSLPSQTHPAPR